ncbi:hypothetical protein CHGG_06780 [Chaetomium globosum CBS 148.51]|uniref:Uncharacterized protein n=1 Tax=Chaetomium globosum (strain ATCC 6205 / CBS 148.51 / DSM 1962 / NBRC 6347 / NRRL 1970) TaxID=306901 RepID=Q2H3I5_CHAGB|nr:uncharacterized protein CHGG_06780 [Chaetomium globosum CBS 148.51]EAQ90161.1 hypothetical protein CHGG_06780 [Chaetomium globosum CBS 148.51]
MALSRHSLLVILLLFLSHSQTCSTQDPPSLSSYDFDFLTHLNWDPAAASTFDLVDSASIPAATASGAELHSNFSSPELDFNLDLDLAPCLDAFSTPLFNENNNLNHSNDSNNNFFPLAAPASLPIPPLSSTSTSLTNTPATTDLQSPSPTPPSPDSGALLHPGLKLPQAKAHPSKPGRRPAGARLSHTTDGRVTKRNNHHGAATVSSSASSAVAAAALQQQQEAIGDEIDPEVIDRRHAHSRPSGTARRRSTGSRSWRAR